LFLPGLKCAPVYQAWIEKCSTQDAESQLLSPGYDNLSQILGEELRAHDPEALFSGNPAQSTMDLDVPRQGSLCPGFYARMNREIYDSTCHSSTVNPHVELRTRPGSTSKTSFRPRECEPDIFANGLRYLDPTAAGIDSIPDESRGLDNSSRSRRLTLEESRSIGKLESSPQLESADIEDRLIDEGGVTNPSRCCNKQEPMV
jgi:hypothetical protein